MPRSTVTSKGQVTIPKQVRDALRIGVGDRVSFVVRDDGVVELRPETVDLHELYGSMKRRGKRVTVEQMNAAIAEAAAEPYRRSRRT
jgi:AbrB family looped-hinge helix DNA binding protein